MPPNEQERPVSTPAPPEDPDTAIFTAVRERMTQDGFAPPEEYERSAAWPLREDRDG